MVLEKIHQITAMHYMLDEQYRKNYWWYHDANTFQYSISKIEQEYPEDYYSIIRNHILEDEPELFIKYIIKDIETIIPIKSILEFSSGCGFFTQEMIKHKYDVTVLDGVKMCFKSMHDKNIFPKEEIVHDLRLPIKIENKYDLTLAVEISEHIEPPFAGTFMYNITQASDLIYFTFVDESEPHIHHPNTKPFKYWNNLFNFFGFKLRKKYDIHTNVVQLRHIHRINGYLFERLK